MNRSKRGQGFALDPPKAGGLWKPVRLTKDTGQGGGGLGRAAGFTLLEILVALVVLGFLLAGLSQGTRFGLRAWDIQARMVDRHGELDAVDRTLRRLVQQAEPGAPSDATPLTGTARQMVLTSELPMASAGPAAQAETALADMILTVDAAHRLLLRWTPHRHVQRIGPPPPPRVAELLRGVERLEISYWRRDGAGGWLASWSEPGLPALVRIRILFVAGDQRRWPDVVAAPMLGRQGG